MDSLDTNLSELRTALAERRRRRLSATRDVSPFDGAGIENGSITEMTPMASPAPVRGEPELVRSWFQRLFGG